MAFSVEGKYALVTGGGSGICLAFSRHLLSKSCSVIIGDLRLTPDGETLIKEFPHPSPPGKASVLFHQTNVASWPQLTSLWKTALETFPRIDIVVPGAGLYDPPWSSFWQPPRTDTNPDSLSRDPADADPGHYAVLDVNLVSPIRLSQLAIAHWTKKKQRGCLLHVGSVAGYLAEAASPLYFASKHGLHGFVRSLADLKEQVGIRVSVIAPGPAQTGIWSGDEARAETILKDTRWVTVQEIVDAMHALVVSEAYGDGTVLEVTPGATRVVPLFNALPPVPGSISMPNMGPYHERLFEELKTKGLQA